MNYEYPWDNSYTFYYQRYSQQPRAQLIIASLFTLISSGLISEPANDTGIL